MEKYEVFTAKWCQPCKGLKHSLEVLLQLIPDLDIEYIDIEEDKARVSKRAVRSVPTMIKINDGREIGRKVGVVDFHELNLFVNGD